jgi:ketosteroid isomerase-like protein
MADHPDAIVVRRGYEAFSNGDTATLSELFDEEAVWHEAGSGQISGDFKGRDQILEMLAKATELAGGTLRLDVHDVVANDNHVVGLHHTTATREGRHLDISEVLVFHLRDGRVIEAWHAASNLYAFDHFWE